MTEEEAKTELEKQGILSLEGTGYTSFVALLEAKQSKEQEIRTRGPRKG